MLLDDPPSEVTIIRYVDLTSEEQKSVGLYPLGTANQSAGLVLFQLLRSFSHRFIQFCKGTFPYDSDLRPPLVSSDVYTHFTIISSFIYLLLSTFFSNISDLRRCRGTYSIPPHPHSILYHSHSPRFYNLLRPALESHSIYTLSRHLLRVFPLYSLGITLNKVSSLPSIIFSLHV